MGNKAKNISVIASKGISTRKKSELLLNIINELQSENVLELGTSLGINTLYLSKGNKVAGVKTIEGSVLLAGLAQKNFALCKVKSIELYEEDIQAVLSLFRENNLKFDFVFVDANHTYEATVEYYLELLKITTKEAVVVFDDINWSAGMTKAWNQISQHTSNNLTIENHQLGIVFLGSELENRNYVLNF
jgi:predicted O-methyltransferase YrrM